MNLKEQRHWLTEREWKSNGKVGDGERWRKPDSPWMNLREWHTLGAAFQAERAKLSMLRNIFGEYGGRHEE